MVCPTACTHPDTVDITDITVNVKAAHQYANVAKSSQRSLYILDPL